MPDIKKINGYNLCDEVARGGIDDLKSHLGLTPRPDNLIFTNPVGENGLFGNNATWVNAKCSSVTIKDGECSFIGSERGGYIVSGSWSNTFQIIKDHKYLFFVTMKTNSNYVEMRISSCKVIFSGTGEWKHYTDIVTCSKDGNALFNISNGSSTKYNEEVKVKKAGFIDLTETFGVGNEPTLREANAYMAIWDYWVLENSFNVKDYFNVMNLAPFGDFYSNSWYKNDKVSSLTYTYSNSEVTFTPSESGAWIRPVTSLANQGFTALHKGHQVYYCAFIKTENNQMQLSFNSKYSYIFDGTGEYELISRIATIEEEANQPIEITSRTSATNPVNVKNVSIIDLTEIYGEGKEPTKVWIDNIIMKNGWLARYYDYKRDNHNSIVMNDASFDYETSGIKVLYLNGSTQGMSKSNTVELQYSYQDKTGTCSVKWQGASSIAFEKKNYTIKFDRSFEVKEGWGTQKKYCFKANFIDPSHLRNIGSCRLWGQMVKSRDGAPTSLTSLPNGGAIDGVPCVIILNGKFHGLYTWNIPKDKWLFGSPKAIVMGDSYGNATAFKALATFNGDFELEYVEDENDSDWVLTSFNTLIQSVMDSDGTDIDTVVSQYIDIPSVIDYIHHAADERAGDCLQNNTIFVTYDKVKWYMSVYDRDTTYGFNANGVVRHKPNDPNFNYTNIANINNLMKLIIENKKNDFVARGIELRNGIKSEENVMDVFLTLAAEFPANAFLDDQKAHPTIPSTNAASLSQILNWYRLRRIHLDSILDSM